jgi:Stage II sporulation protein E (SpoIIE)
MGIRAAGYPHRLVAAWRSGTPRSQRHVALIMLSIIAASFVVSVAAPEGMPLAAYFVWLLIAMMLLRFRPLVLVGAADAAAGVLALAITGPITGSRAIEMAAFVMAVLLVLLVASRQRSGLPAILSEAFLVDLRDRLQGQGKIPPLPEGWDSQSAMIAAHGGTYAGDFLVADLSEDRKRLEMILVDVCGKGTHAGPAALQFAGALGGLIGALPPRELFCAANGFLIRQRDDEAFATAVHLLVDLEEGGYQITSGGHPPALRWDLPSREWVIDNARGTALGVLRAPELHVSKGHLLPGEALMFYTDGVVEARGSDIDAGIAWLQRAAREAIGHGFGGAARRIIGQVESGDDDRAVLILSRTVVESPVVDQSSVS